MFMPFVGIGFPNFETYPLSQCLRFHTRIGLHLSNVQNPVDIPLYWLVDRDPYNGHFGSRVLSAQLGVYGWLEITSRGIKSILFLTFLLGLCCAMAAASDTESSEPDTGSKRSDVQLWSGLPRDFRELKPTP